MNLLCTGQEASDAEKRRAVISGPESIFCPVLRWIS